MHKLALILADIRSTHNVGSILRSAEGFGVTHVFYAGYTPYPHRANDTRLPHSSQKLHNQIKKTALGAETLPSSVFSSTLDAIAAARQAGYRTIIGLEQTATSTALPKFELRENTALVLGNEVAGISSEILAACTVILEIPMLGTKESFNVSVAAGIALYALRTQGVQ